MRYLLVVVMVPVSLLLLGQVQETESPTRMTREEFISKFGRQPEDLLAPISQTEIEESKDRPTKVTLEDYRASGFVPIRWGFGSGNSFLELSERDRQSYMAGYVDALISGELWSLPQSRVDALDKTLSGKPIEQIVAVIEKELQDHPERRDELLGVVVYRAFTTAWPNLLPKS